MAAVAGFDFAAFIAALDDERRERQLGWYDVAGELWDQSRELNSRRPDDHPLCGGAVGRLGARGETSCQYALFAFRWLRRPPEDFVTGGIDVGDTTLPEPGPGSRLRFDLNQLHGAIDERRRERHLTWAALADELRCTPGRLTNLRTARQADLALVMRTTQWLGLPAATFVHAADW